MNIGTLEFQKLEDVEYLSMEEYLKLLVVPLKVLPSEIVRVLRKEYSPYIFKLNFKSFSKISKSITEEDVTQANLKYIIQYLKGGMLVLGNTTLEDLFSRVDISYTKDISYHQHLLNCSNQLSDNLFYSPYVKDSKDSDRYVILKSLQKTVEGYTAILYESLRGSDSTILGKDISNSLILTTNLDKLFIEPTLISVNN